MVLVRSANMRTTTGRTKQADCSTISTGGDQPTDEGTTNDQNQITDNDTTRPVRRAAERSRARVKEWIMIPQRM